MSFLLGIIYLSFISLGLPDALLGAAWPNMYPEFHIRYMTLRYPSLSAFVCGDDFHDYCIGNHHFQLTK